MIKRVLVSLFLLTLLSAPSLAQERVYDPGSIWVITTVETNPGKFNAYIADLKNVWKRYLDAQKKDGIVESYRMFQIAFPRHDEPDLVLMVEFPNWEAFDKGDVEYFEKLAKDLQGSITNAQDATVDRGALRTIRSNIVAQEITFQK